jgi:protein gp37
LSDKSKIEWTDATWNPVTGCSKVSEGCRNCYAMKFAERWRGTPGHYYENGFDITLRPDKLDEPLHWRRPRRIFVNSMSDLFHEKVPFDFIRTVFTIMAEANWHTFQILTKRPDRMKNVLDQLSWRFDGLIFNGSKVTWPLPNVWLGVSVENQRAADERIPLLLQTPAAVRFLSMEPLLGPVDLRNIDYDRTVKIDCLTGLHGWPYPHAEQDKRIHWVIVGGESGPGARPMHPDWVRSLRDQCHAAGVPFFFKQWGEFLPHESNEDDPEFWVTESGSCGYVHTSMPTESWITYMNRVGKKAAGRLLDGRTWDEMPG